MRIRWRGLELPSQVVCDASTLTPRYGRFVAEPFERGFGVTIGNSLRRVLLSSIEGSAVTQIKIHGAQHEFTTLPGVVEDVTDIVLNVKSLVVKNHSDSTKVIRVEKKQRGVVTGGDVDPGTLVSEEYLMTLERQAFCALITNPKTQERILGMLNTGKPVRN